jgi:hypothetical protein
MVKISTTFKNCKWWKPNSICLKKIRQGKKAQDIKQEMATKNIAIAVNWYLQT